MKTPVIPAKGLPLPPVIPAKAGTQAPVSITYQPVIPMKTPVITSTGLPQPPVIPAKAGTQAPVSTTHQPVITMKTPRHPRKRPALDLIGGGDPDPRLHNPLTRNCQEIGPSSMTFASCQAS